MNTLEQWASEAKLKAPENRPLEILEAEHPDRDRFYYVDKDERILALIDLIRKKDLLISEMKNESLEFKGPVALHYIETTCDVLLALTEQLK